jgi:hypothetical protein
MKIPGAEKISAPLPCADFEEGLDPEDSMENVQRLRTLLHNRAAQASLCVLAIDNPRSGNKLDNRSLNSGLDRCLRLVR